MDVVCRERRREQPGHELAHLVGLEVLACFRSEEHTSELQSHSDLVCRLLLEKKKKQELSHHLLSRVVCFFSNDPATTEIYTLSLHDALPISSGPPKPTFQLILR